MDLDFELDQHAEIVDRHLCNQKQIWSKYFTCIKLHRNLLLNGHVAWNRDQKHYLYQVL